MLVRQRSTIRLDSITPPAGLLATLPALQERVSLLPGDWLLIFSHGIPESTSASGEEFGDNRLLDALARLGSGTAAQV